MSYPYWKQGPSTQPATFFYKLTMKKLKKNWLMHDQLQLLATILTRWLCPVASTKALDLPHQAMHVVLYWRTTAAIIMASKVGPLFYRCFVCCCPGGHWDNTEQVVTQWRRPVASGKALDVLHQEMCTVLHPCLPMATKMANNRGAFVHLCHLFCVIIHSYKTMLWSIKTNPELQY